MKILLRLRLEGMCVVEMDPDTIRTFRITDDTDNGTYILSMANDSQEYILHSGSPDSCHALLNRIHNMLDVHIKDIV